MAQSGYTPIKIYSSATAAAVPLAANLVAGELAINTADGKLYFENSSGVVTLLASSNITSMLDGISTTQGAILYRGASSWAALSPGTSGYVLQTNGGGADPSWAIGGGGGAVTSFSAGSTGLTPSTATTGAITLAGKLGVGFGGTGLATYTIGDTVYASATTTITKLAIGTAYQISAVNAGATAPSWQGLSSLIDNALSASTQGQILYRNASAWVPLSPGTSGQVLTTGGAAANPSWATAAAGLTGFTAAQDSIAPNATIPVSTLTATAAAASVDIAIIPKGVGAFMLALPDATTAGGNKRGNYAIDLQLVRASASQVASSNNAGILGGQSNTATATYAVVIGGDTNTASGSYALAHGTNSTANAVQSMAVGAWASSRGVVGYRAFAPNSPIAAALGNTQMGFVTVGVETTDATPTILRSNTSAAASTNQYYVPSQGITTFTIMVVCGITGASNAKAWEFKGAAKKGATEGSNILVGALTKNVLAADAGASAWDVAVTANTTTGAITITATGQAATTIRWSATIIATEVSY